MAEPTNLNPGQDAESPGPRIAWVTGASGALGRRIAAVLHGRGYRVVLSSRHIDAEPTGQRIGEPLALDVTDRAAVERAAAAIVATHGRIDALVTCTAAPAFGDFLSLDDAAWQLALDTKLMGTVRTVRAVLPFMLTRGQGRIVLVSGRGGTVPPPRHLPGACANAAINLLAQGLATAYGRQGIRVNALAPGPVASARFDTMQAAVAPGVHNALGEAAQPEDVAQAVLFLLSDEARHITGTTLHIDGGRESPA